MNNVGHWPTFRPQCTKDAQSVGLRQDLEDGAQEDGGAGFKIHGRHLINISHVIYV